jgi:hypothetical protein
MRIVSICSSHSFSRSRSMTSIPAVVLLATIRQVGYHVSFVSREETWCKWRASGCNPLSGGCRPALPSSTTRDNRSPQTAPACFSLVTRRQRTADQTSHSVTTRLRIVTTSLSLSFLLVVHVHPVVVLSLLIFPATLCTSTQTSLSLLLTSSPSSMPLMTENWPPHAVFD